MIYKNKIKLLFISKKGLPTKLVETFLFNVRFFFQNIERIRPSSKKVKDPKKENAIIYVHKNPLVY